MFLAAVFTSGMLFPVTNTLEIRADPGFCQGGEGGGVVSWRKSLIGGVLHEKILKMWTVT